VARSVIIGCGYVGAALATRLAGDGHEVVCVRRSDAGAPAGTRLLLADVARPETLTALPACGSLFYTVAADGSSEAAYRSAYVDGLTNVIDALRRGGRLPQRLIVTTSTAVYGQDAGEWLDEASPTAPSRFQGRVLLESEAVARSAGVTSVCVRLGGIYGPGRTRLIDAVRRGNATVPSYPSYTNRVHRDDCAGLLRHVAALADPDPVYVGVDRDPADYRDVVTWLAARLRAPAPRIEDPDGSALTEARGATGSAAGARGKRCRSDRLVDSGYRFAYPTFREGYAALL
jgi:nucleoside-diphosphate-sugar epimerase